MSKKKINMPDKKHVGGKTGNGKAGSAGKFSIRMKIAATICGMVLIVSLLIDTIAIYSITKSTYNALEVSMHNAADIAANVVSTELEVHIAQLENVSKQVNAMQSIPLKRAKIDTLTAEYGYQFLGMADETGTLAGVEETTNVAEEEFFIACRDTLKPYISDLMVSDSFPMTTILVAIPYLENGVFKGVMYGIEDAGFINDLIKTLKMGETGSTYILSSTGDTLAHEDISMVYAKNNPIKNAEKDPVWKDIAEANRKAINGEKSTSTYTYKGIRKIATGSIIPGTKGWALVITANREEFTKTLMTSILILIGASCGLVAVAFAVSLIASNSIALPIRELEESVRQMAGGDLNVSISSRGSDEVAQLADSMRRMQNSLRAYVNEIKRCLSELAKGNLTIAVDDLFSGDFNEIHDSLDQIISALKESFSEVKESAERIAASSEQVASGAQTLASGTAEQASTIEQISAMIQEIATQAEQTAKNTDEADVKTKATVGEIERCNAEMQSLSEAMDEIAKASNEISKIIRTIEDIAFQTNILALNAAVEAARAGDAGKGFAVVADEVRNLASKSAEAAQNTTLLIQSTVEAVQNGTVITEKTASSLSHVVNNVREMGSLINRIAVAAEQQARSVEQVNMGVEQISSVIQTNSATSEESAAVSQEMMAFAQTLKKITESLRIK